MEKNSMSIQQAYNEWSQTYDSDRNLTRDLDHQILREVLANCQLDSILELGCGTGKNTVVLAQLGRGVHALDFSEGMIAKAREKVSADHVIFSVADLTQRWPCDDSAYDLIACNLVLEHIEDLSFIFSEVSRVLVPGGQFLVHELHPFRQYDGRKARYESREGVIEVDAFVHHISDFLHAASQKALTLKRLNEHWHEQDQGRLPRLVSFLFENV
jgi:malonyl-CoA O-methyltransferase